MLEIDFKFTRQIKVAIGYKSETAISVQLSHYTQFEI